ncbi:hypothetical protein [Pseudomonas sp.]|uniref:hypothetical protein n=1 Tax=Pseudomonas sp. TaxID=306 RepID=UPI003241BA56
MSLGLWLLPVMALFLRSKNVVSQIAGFFNLRAVVTFGGTCALPAYVAQQAVETNAGWSPGRC